MHLIIFQQALVCSLLALSSAIPTISSPSFQPSTSQAPSLSTGPSEVSSLFPTDMPSLTPSSVPSCVEKGTGKAGSTEKKMGKKGGKASYSAQASKPVDFLKGGKKRNRRANKSDMCDSSFSDDGGEEEIEESVISFYEKKEVVNALENAPSGTMSWTFGAARTLTGLIMMFRLI